MNGQPPHMIAAQNVTTTDTMLHMASIGVGGLMRPPIATWQIAATTSADDQRRERQQQALRRLAAVRPRTRGRRRQVTAATICIGITQRRK